ncbi:MAG: hypothetical protein QNJ87_11240 [Gammaproteobacteria bacterium]|nr:hypothetical protein [Gammaproteobacteria bacterium]MDJ0893064.1 hypothetical protein [Gammaproteobacteria bacterium]
MTCRLAVRLQQAPVFASDGARNLRVGESKYGKPILDRALKPEVFLVMAGRVGL